jgi:translation elongation factor EF-G
MAPDGKTTLADLLVAHGGGRQVHRKMAGSLSSLHYFEEEKRRHIDFCSEASAAALLGLYEMLGQGLLA